MMPLSTAILLETIFPSLAFHPEHHCFPIPFVAYRVANVKTCGRAKHGKRCESLRYFKELLCQDLLCQAAGQHTNIIDMCLNVWFWGYRWSNTTLCRRMDNGQIAILRTWAVCQTSLVPIRITLDHDHSRVLFGVFRSKEPPANVS